MDFGDHKSESCYISVFGCDMMCSVSSESQVDLPKVLQLQSSLDSMIEQHSGQPHP